MSEWWREPAAQISTQHQRLAQQRQSQLTKPPGSLGRLEQVSIDFAGWQHKEKPTLDQVAVRVFAADHGVVDEGVSAFPQVVTGEMIRNFSRGGAAVSVLSRQQGAQFSVINMGTIKPMETLPDVKNEQIMLGTNNFCHGAAMTQAVLEQALDCGRRHVPTDDCQLLVGGEMGIGNTTAAAALSSALLGLPVATTVGRGTGLDDVGLQRKREVVVAALEFHANALDGPEAILRCLGGLEIVALCGAYIAAAQAGIPSLVDGYICTAAALLACRLNATLRPWLVFSHRSAEPGHGVMLEALDAKALLDLDLRLGEGSGAMLVLPLLKSALSLHSEMATFDEAGVSDKD